MERPTPPSPTPLMSRRNRPGSARPMRGRWPARHRGRWCPSSSDAGSLPRPSRPGCAWSREPHVVADRDAEAAAPGTSKTQNSVPPATSRSYGRNGNTCEARDDLALGIDHRHGVVTTDPSGPSTRSNNEPGSASPVSRASSVSRVSVGPGSGSALWCRGPRAPARRRAPSEPREAAADVAQVIAHALDVVLEGRDVHLHAGDAEVAMHGAVHCGSFLSTDDCWPGHESSPGNGLFASSLWLGWFVKKVKNRIVEEPIPGVENALAAAGKARIAAPRRSIFKPFFDASSLSHRVARRKIKALRDVGGACRSQRAHGCEAQGAHFLGGPRRVARSDVVCDWS